MSPTPLLNQGKVHPTRSANPPELAEIPFRLATQPEFRAWMSDLLRHSGPKRVHGVGSSALGGVLVDLATSQQLAKQNTLSRLNPDDPEGVIPALIDAWSTVLDILTFYQERSANEGFLKTALIPDSVTALAKMAGYSRRPSISATTYLAFTLIDAVERSNPLLIKKGVAVQSVPMQGQIPVLFETDSDIEARRSWNALSPWCPPAFPTYPIVGGATRLTLKGQITGLKPGLPILIRNTAPESTGPKYVIRKLTAIERDTKSGTTVVEWGIPLPGPVGSSLMEEGEITVFRLDARFFGSTILPWSKIPHQIQATYGIRKGNVAAIPFERLAVEGLPSGDTTVMMVGPDGNIYCAIADSVLRLSATYQWTLLGKLPLQAKATALALDGNGKFYVGTDQGVVLASHDGCQTWFPVQGSSQGKRPVKASIRLRQTVIRALLLMTNKNGVNDLIACTDLGVWQTTVNGSWWYGWNTGLPGFDKATGGAALSVTDIVRDPKHPHRFIIASNFGPFHANGYKARWTAAKVDLHQKGLIERVEDEVELIENRLVSQAKSLFHTISSSIGKIFSKIEAKSVPVSDQTTQPDAAAASPHPDTSEKQVPSPQVTGMALLMTDTRRAEIFSFHSTGLLRSSDGGHSWRPSNFETDTLPLKAISTLAADGDRLFAGTSEGLKVSTDLGKSWSTVPGLFEDNPVMKLAAGQGNVIAAGPFGGYSEPDWTPLSFETRENTTSLYLDRRYDSILPGSWIVTEDGATGDLDAYKVANCEGVLQGTIQTRRVSRIDLNGPSNPLPVATSRIYLNGMTAELATDVPAPSAYLFGETIKISGVVDGDLTNHLIALTGQPATARIIAELGGVRIWNTAQSVLSLKSPSFLSVYCLASLKIGPKARLIAGTQIGVVEYIDDVWVQLGQLQPRAHALLELPNGQIAAASESGVWLWSSHPEPSKTDWVMSGLANHAVDCLMFDETEKTLWAGTNTGLWRCSLDSLNETSAWALSKETDGRAIISLAQLDGILFAALADGNLWSYSQLHWGQHTSPPATKINALVTSGSRLFAATTRGVFWSDDQGVSWNADRSSIDDDVVALAVGDDGAIVSGVHATGLRMGETLYPFGIVNAIKSMLFHEGSLFVGFNFTTTVFPTDPHNGERYLESKFVRLTTDKELELELVKGPASPNLRKIFADYDIALSDTTYVTEQAGETIWRVNDPKSSVAWLVTPIDRSDAPKKWVLFRSIIFDVIGTPVTVDKKQGLQRWHLRLDDESVYSVIAKAGELEFASARAKTKTLSEVRKVIGQHVSADQSHTVLEVSEALENVYDAVTTIVNANVAPASHGDSGVIYEVVGSGDASSANQTFPLLRKPISTRTTDTAPFYEFNISVRVGSGSPSDSIDANSALVKENVENTSVEWTPVFNLSNSGPSDEHYQVTCDDAGTAFLNFGDGIHGKRLPTGVENVVAHYRVGSGPEGNVSAGQLSLMVRRPPGIKKVLNPVAAEGGALGDAMNDLRALAPKRVSRAQRLVSRGDFLRFVSDWPGIAKASVTLLKEQGRVVHISVADIGLASLSPSAIPGNPTYSDTLLAALKANSAADYPIIVQRCRILWFDLHAEITVKEGFDNTAVTSQIRSNLLTMYGFNYRALGESVYLSHVTTAIQRMPGVQGVRIRSFNFTADKAGIATKLSASPAGLTPEGDFVSTELVLINPLQPSPDGFGGTAIAPYLK